MLRGAPRFARHLAPLRAGVTTHRATQSDSEDKGARAGRFAAACFAVATVANLPEREKRRGSRCEETDWVTVTLAGTAIVGGAALAAYMVFSPAPAAEEFPAKLDAAFRSSPTARKVLADVPYAHPDLKLSDDEAPDYLKGSKADVLSASRIRFSWATLLSEVYHMPREMFMKTKRGGGEGVTPGVFVIPISRLERSEYAKTKLAGIVNFAKAVDRDGSGTLDFHEFATLMLVLTEFYEEEWKGGKSVLGTKPRTNKRPKADVLKLLYSILDENGDNRVTKTEFESFVLMMAKLGHVQPSAGQNYDAMWKTFDINEDGHMSYTEFVAFAKQILDLESFPGAWPPCPEIVIAGK